MILRPDFSGFLDERDTERDEDDEEEGDEGEGDEEEETCSGSLINTKI